MEKRVVITGMGIWSCLGTDIKTVKDSLFAGRSGIGLQQERITYGYRSALTGIVEEPVITKQMIDRHTRAGMSEEARYAYMASRQAFEQSGIDDQYLRQNEVGCIFGNDSSAKPVIEAAKIMDEKHDSAMLGYGIIFQSMNSTVNMNLSTIFHLRGVNFTVSSACASGSHSIGAEKARACGALWPSRRSGCPCGFSRLVRSGLHHRRRHQHQRRPIHISTCIAAIKDTKTNHKTESPHTSHNKWKNE